MPRTSPRLVPPDKKLDPQWVKSLFARGEPTIYRGESLALIGMPIGGLCAGQLYLGGDGKLWHWDIFNRVEHTNEAHYANPMRPASPLDQGFAVRIKSGDKTEIRTLDRAGFSDVRFRGEYPIGFVDYRDADSPVEVSLEAFSPFIPLNTADSSLPATMLDLPGQERVAGSRSRSSWAAGSKTPSCLDTGRPADGLPGQPGRARAGPAPPRMLGRAGRRSLRPGATAAPIVLADFDGENYGKWTAEGQAFGNRPSSGARRSRAAPERLPGQGPGQHLDRQRRTPGQAGLARRSRIDRDYLNFLIGGGNHPDETCINLLVDGQVVRTATGKNTDAMEWAGWDVRDLAGQGGPDRDRRPALRRLGTYRHRPDRAGRHAQNAPGSRWPAGTTTARCAWPC